MTLACLDLILADRNIALGHGKARQPLDGKALKHIVINGRLLAACVDGLFALRIPHDNIGICPLEDRTLARIHVERLGNVG